MTPINFLFEVVKRSPFPADGPLRCYYCNVGLGEMVGEHRDHSPSCLYRQGLRMVFDFADEDPFGAKRGIGTDHRCQHCKCSQNELSVFAKPHYEYCPFRLANELLGRKDYDQKYR